MEMPESTAVRILEETPTPLNPLGVKGAGEGGSSGCGAAIANAVADALAPLGVPITALPLSPDRLSALIRAARKGASCWRLARSLSAGVLLIPSPPPGR